MKENNKGSMIILTVIGIATLLVAVIGATFAYFTATIEYKTEPTQAVIKSNTMIVEFATKNQINYTGAIPGRPEEDYSKFKDNKLRFTLTSDPLLATETKYDVYLVIDKSEFVKNPDANNATDELVYVTTPPTQSNGTRTISEESTKNGTPPTVGADGLANYNNEINGNKYEPEKLLITKKDPTTNVDLEDEVIVGLIPSNISYADDVTEEEKVRIKVGSGVLASHDSSDEWQIEVWLKETQGEQNYNQGKTMEAHIDIVVTDAGYVSNEIKTTKATQ